MPLPLRAEVILGRGEGCDVVIDDEAVSRSHAMIRDHRLIRDLDSRNGTIVGGRRLASGKEVRLGVGTVVELGSVSIVIVAGRPTRTSESPPVERASVVRDPTMVHLYELIDVIAPSDLSVLILGETGTGKELFAEALHERSPRSKTPLLRVNCAALSGSLLEGELFGYERGAFTGAVSAKPGLFEAASGGTLFLDEVGELPLDTQAKLLRVIDNEEVFRLGSLKPRRIDVRYVAATNRDLEAAVEVGAFRRDLYFRLNGFAVTLPPLRLRRSEIVPMAEHFLARLAQRQGVGAPSLDVETIRALIAYSFPGNARELRQLMERAFAIVQGGRNVRPEHIWPSASLPRPRHTRGIDLGRAEIEDALRRTNGNQTKAAELLGVARRTLINKIEALGIPRPRKKSDA